MNPTQLNSYKSFKKANNLLFTLHRNGVMVVDKNILHNNTLSITKVPT